MRASILNTIAITSLTGVGAKVAEKLDKLQIFTVQDLLFHLPYRYEDRSRIWPIQSLMPGQYAATQGTIAEHHISAGRRRMLTIKITEGNAFLTLRFFNFNASIKNTFQIGLPVKVYGEIKRGQIGLEIIHPEFTLLSSLSQTQQEERLTPVYPTTEGLRQITLRSITEQALALLDETALQELLPEGLYDKQITLKEALHFLHHPKADASLFAIEKGEHPAQKRMIIEELLAQNLSMLALRSKLQQDPALPLSASTQLRSAFLAQLTFRPTGAQSRVAAEIEQDMMKTKPMMRLVQGDVGSGKTLVAALAALQAIEHNVQVALMAPTDLLAEQHAINFENWFSPLGICVARLAGKLSTKTKNEELAKIESGEAKMVIGTHALFQKHVIFKNLALIIIDEQHRFGVHQRLALREKGVLQGTHPHQLIMTATPIPRTLAMTAYADLDTSIIDELPPGRTPIKTVAIPDTRRIEIINRVHEVCVQEGRQAYWVCTLIDESEVLEAQAASDTADDLSRALPNLNIGLVHGRMKASEKQEIMQAFKQGKIHLLVATTVIEVGVDVPNASLMIIENPERLGLAQLHQLRGRVGRGTAVSHCVLLYHAPLSKTATQRLGVLRENTDGFIIAERDLEIRGPGELLGTKQTGMAEFKIADLVRDQKLIPEVQKMALYLHERYPENAKAIIKRWLENKDQYSHA